MSFCVTLCRDAAPPCRALHVARVGCRPHAAPWARPHPALPQWSHPSTRQPYSRDGGSASPIGVLRWPVVHQTKGPKGDGCCPPPPAAPHQQQQGSASLQLPGTSLPAFLPSHQVPRAPALCSPSLTGAVPVLPPQCRAGCSQRAFFPPPPSLWLCFTTHFISCQEPNVFFKEWVIATNVLNAIALAAVSVPRLNYYN